MQAPDYTPTTNFAEDARNNAGGREPVRCDRLDAELDAIKESNNTINANLQLLQRDDGTLRDQIVEPYALSPSARAYIQGSRFNPRGQWASGIAYAVGDLVDYLGDSYVCAIAHTATAFAADYAAGRWQVFATGGNAANTEFQPTSGISSTNVQDAVEEVQAKASAASNPLLSGLYGGL